MKTIMLLIQILVSQKYEILISCHKSDTKWAIRRSIASTAPSSKNTPLLSSNTNSKSSGTSNTEGGRANTENRNHNTKGSAEAINKELYESVDIDIEDEEEGLSKRSSSGYTSGLGGAIAMVLKKQLSSDRLVLITRIGLVYVIGTELWKSIRFAWEDWIDELESTSLGGGGSLHEDHDQPYFAAESILGLNGTNTATEGEAQAQGENNRSSRRRRAVGVTSYARELAIRLHACGIPLQSTNSDACTVYSVLSSLTKTEGQLLSNCLLASNSKTSSDSNSLLWSSIAGLSHVQEALMDILYSFLQPPPPNYSSLLSSSTNGILLYGPPGTGKTMVARALAQSTNIRFLSVSPSSLLRKYVGETNLHIRALFSLAKKLQPCIIFIDEMDGLFRERTSGAEEHDVSRDLKTEFMSLWDGITQDNQHKMLVIGATNRPFDVDSAFLRRMSRSFFISLPDLQARVQYLQIALRTIPLEEAFDPTYIATILDGYSPSDMKQVLHTAALIPLREARNFYNVHKRPGALLPPLRKLTTQDVITAKQVVPPTQWSNQYRMQLAEYAQRVNFGMAPYKDSSLQRQHQQQANPAPSSSECTVNHFAFDDTPNSPNDNAYDEESSSSDYDISDGDEEYEMDDDTDDTDDHLF